MAETTSYESVSLNLDISSFTQELTKAIAQTNKFKDGFKEGIKANIDLDASKFEQVKAQMSAGFEQMKKGASDVRGGIGQIATEWKKVQLAVAGMGALSVKEFAQVEGQIKRNSALMQASREEQQAMLKQTRDLATSATFSADAQKEIAQAYEYMALAGWSANESMEAMPSAMDLVTVSGENAQQVVDILTDNLASFGFTAKESSQFGDILATTISKSNTGMKDLGEAFKYVAPLAGALKVSANDVAVALGLMANAGIKGSQAGTHLRTFLTSLSSPSKEAQTALQNLGIQTTDTSGKMLPLRDIIANLREKFNGLSETQKAQVAETLVGKEAMSGFLAIMNASETEVNNLTNAIDNSTGSAKKMAEEMGQGFGASLIQLQNTLKVVAGELGEAMAPAIQGITKNIQKVLEEFRKLDTESKQKVANFVLACMGATAVTPILGSVANVIGGTVTAVKGSFTMLSGAIGLLKGAGTGLITVLTGINPIFLAIGAGIAVLFATNEQFRDSIKGLASGVLELVKTLGTALKPVLETLGMAFMSILQALQPLIEILGGVLGAVLSAIIDTLTVLIKTILTPLIETILPPLVIALTGVATAIQIIGVIAEGVFGFLKEGFLGIFALLAGKPEEAVEHFKQAGESIIGIEQGIEEAIKGASERIAQYHGEKESEKTATTQANATKRGATERAEAQKTEAETKASVQRTTAESSRSWDSFSNFFKLKNKENTDNILKNNREQLEDSSRNWEAVKNKFTELKEHIKQKSVEWKNSIIDTFSCMKGAFFTTGEDIIDGIWAGFESGIDWLGRKVRNAIDSLTDWASSSIDYITSSFDFGFYSMEPVGVSFMAMEPSLARSFAVTERVAQAPQPPLVNSIANKTEEGFIDKNKKQPQPITSTTDNSQTTNYWNFTINEATNPQETAEEIRRLINRQSTI